MSGKIKPDDTEEIAVVLDRKEVEYLLEGFPKLTQQQCVAFQNLDLMEFCGNQHNEMWRWRFKELKKLYPTIHGLWEFYRNLKNPYYG